ncbi:hypothetical protein SAMN05661093_05102 [Kibdelosporangium aridum]|uniref:Uncharacterized protein n=1 Tax=Kibdelosporangium aridum TaxID=2030 RepID=A0A1Y5XS43_KIBAR|nr:hypothetical protein SAMN05661093_05102 [Kibdelosporangium aridum]
MAPSAADYFRQHQVLDRLVMGEERPRSIEDLRRYFREDGPVAELVTGRRVRAGGWLR